MIIELPEDGTMASEPLPFATSITLKPSSVSVIWSSIPAEPWDIATDAQSHSSVSLFLYIFTFMLSVRFGRGAHSFE